MKNRPDSNEGWYKIDNVQEVSSPSLLIYPVRVEANIRKMIEIAGSADRLRPHVKTHKMAEIIKLQMKYGIYKFKCATISETEMVASCGAPDILLAVQPVGPNIGRFLKLKQEFNSTKISCIADNEEVIIQLSDMARKTGRETHVWLDINNGMNRTGVIPGEKAARLFKRIIDSPMLVAEGLHVYDGHIHEPDLSLREKICNDSFAPVISLIEDLKNEGISPVKIIAGGTPTFPIHALRKGVECSPGTLILWDENSCSFSDMDFLFAAVLLTRVISKPGKELLCLDLGHKAIASEMPQPRIKLLEIEKYAIVSHNEEHMVIRTTQADKYKIGDPLYGIPWHICPTVDRYDIVYVVNDHNVTGQWDVEARNRKITI
ncbi:MAG: D-TA family PLP-dependent enzyme [Bacteroidales bacterium]|jgi:D-serine deaminase-like pyridoxal phosphate-dependent protein